MDSQNLDMAGRQFCRKVRVRVLGLGIGDFDCPDSDILKSAISAYSAIDCYQVWKGAQYGKHGRAV